MIEEMAVPADLASNTPRPSAYNPRLLGNGSMVPYVGSWSDEESLSEDVIQHPMGGIRYVHETLMDRDEWGVLWARTATRIGSGRPLFKTMHPLRQRRAMSRLLCQVCAQPADQTERGHLWLLPAQPSYDASWPEGIPVTSPPVCVTCARLSVQMCPALRSGYVAVRAESWICGVSGVRFEPSPAGLRPASDQDDDFVYYSDPAARWMIAIQRARMLHKCIFVDLESLTS